MKRTTTFLAAAFVLAAACGTQETGDDGDDTPAADAAPATGQFTLAWTLTEGAAAVTCAQVKAESVVVKLAPVSGAPGSVDVFPCAAGMATSMPREATTYHVDILLRDALGNSMVELPRRMAVVLPPGGPTAFDAADFAVSSVGTIKFTIDAGGASGENCGPEAMMGAGITTMRVELQSVAGMCMPLAFSVAAGAVGGAQSLAAACPGPDATCIENDQEVTAVDVPAGDYRVKVIGFEAGSPADACYDGATQFTLAGGVDYDLGTITLPLVGTNMSCMAP